MQHDIDPPPIAVSMGNPTEVEPGLPQLIAPPPPVGSTFPIPKVRRLLKEAAEQLKRSMGTLTGIEQRIDVELDDLTVDALVCGATDTRFPILTTGRKVEDYRARARARSLDRWASLAKDELEDALAAIEAAQSALKAISLLDEPIPGEWGNLPAVPLARKLNVLGHALLRGRIAGVSL